MFTLAKKSELASDEDESSKSDGYLWAYMLFFTVISAIRWRVGVDSQNYIGIFQEGIIREGSKEYLWDSLVSFVHGNGLPFVIGTGVVAFFQIFFLCKGLKGYRQLLIWLPIVLFGGRYYFDLMNGVRQMMVMCGFFFLTRYVTEKKIVRYIIGILILSLIHQSALLLLPVCLLAFAPLEKINLPDKRFLGLALLAVCFIVGRTPAFQGAMRYLENVLALTGYEDNYLDYYDQILSGEYSEALSLGPIMISYLLSSAIIIWYGPELKAFYEEKIPYFNLWYLCSLFYACGYFLVCNLSHMMIRPFQYFEVFQMVLLTMLLNYLSHKEESGRYILYATIFLIWTCTLISLWKDTGSPIEFTTYKVFFGRL